MEFNKIKELLKGISLPALILDVDAFDENCKQIAEKAQGKTIRIASKSIRSVSVLKRIFHSSPIYKGITSYSPKEALFLDDQGFDDILIGYPTWDDDAHAEIAKRNFKGRNITLMVDSNEQIKQLNTIAEKVNGHFYVCIDIDMSTKFGPLHFGVRRSPLITTDDVLQLAHEIKKSPRLELVGVMGYEAQIAGVSDKLPSQRLKNAAVAYLKKKSLHTIHKRRKSIVEALKREGFSLKFVNGGGTGRLHTTAKDDSVTEITAGSGFYAPLLFDYYRDFRYKAALFFALPVVRKPAPNMYTCLGGGYVSSGPPGEDKVPQPIYPRGGKLLPFEGAGEVQTPVYFEKVTLEIGNPVVFRAAKAGEICERFSEMITVSNGKIIGSYATYRGDGQCFL